MPVIRVRDIVVKYDRLSKPGRFAIWLEKHSLSFMLIVGLIYDGMLVWFFFFRN